MKLLKKLCCLCCVLALCTAFLPSAVFADDKVLNIAFVGLYGSGKSALISAAAGREFDFNSRFPGIKLNVVCQNLRYLDKDIICHLYDTYGDDKGVDKSRKLAMKADIVVVIVDASLLSKGHHVWKETFTKWISCIQAAKPDLPILVAITKIDDADEAVIGAIKDKCSHLKAAYSDTANFNYVAVSALKGTNLGSATSADDFGDNFWGKVRCFIRDSNMYDKLKDEGPHEQKPTGDPCCIQ